MEEVEALAHRIAGDGAAPAALAQARAFAEAQVDLDRIRSVRRHVLGRLMTGSGDEDRGKDHLGDGVDDGADGPELLRQLGRLERYERRALGRRKRATRRGGRHGGPPVERNERRRFLQPARRSLACGLDRVADIPWPPSPPRGTTGAPPSELS